MPRYIDADALLERMEVRLKQLRTEYGDHDHYTDGFDEGLVAVEDATTADVVEVVRCKDCIHGKPIDTIVSCRHYKPECIICSCEEVAGDGAMVYFPDHYCSYGERKKETEI